jgi:hypothetical protein
MPIRFVDKFMTDSKSSSRPMKVSSSAVARWTMARVFDRFFDALGHMNAMIESNVEAKRSVRLGKVVDRDEVVLHVFDPLGKKQWKAWDWQDGKLTLSAIAGYEGEWYGPLEVPK